MNFETRYLVRWGIPGWIFIILLSLYFLIRDIESFTHSMPQGNGSTIVATGAILAVIGIPIGYLFNQLHHTLTFVLTRKFHGYKGWDEYFSFEARFENYFFTYEVQRDNEDSEQKTGIGEKILERYKYLLSRIHEIGSICFAIIFSEVFLTYWETFIGGKINLTIIIYHIVIICLLVLLLIDRCYFKRNLEVFVNYHSNIAGLKKYYRD
ncbi:hypothetical protein [Rossellomorea sp. BNER]|uniref:hypothetical protein n=1 Tax=Rossellomorea sp. BNER TaxID=2962031 RepID=UPI003AF2A21B|nr:hypothetical protein [Rossellomorea sp. BNER]